MAKRNNFQIKSKKDATCFVRELKNNSREFSYELPLMGINGGVVTVRFITQQKEGKIISSSSGYHNVKSCSIPCIVNFIWHDRKHINEELRYQVPTYTQQFNGKH